MPRVAAFVEYMCRLCKAIKLSECWLLLSWKVHVVGDLRVYIYHARLVSNMASIDRHLSVYFRSPRDPSQVVELSCNLRLVQGRLSSTRERANTNWPWYLVQGIRPAASLPGLLPPQAYQEYQEYSCLVCSPCKHTPMLIQHRSPDEATGPWIALLWLTSKPRLLTNSQDSSIVGLYCYER